MHLNKVLVLIKASQRKIVKVDCQSFSFRLISRRIPFALGRKIVATIILFLIPCGLSANVGSSFTVTGAVLIGPEVARSTFPANVGDEQFALKLSSGLSISVGGVEFANDTFQEVVPLLVESG